MNPHPFTVIRIHAHKQQNVISRHNTLSEAQAAARRAFFKEPQTEDSFGVVRTRGHSVFVVPPGTPWVVSFAADGETRLVHEGGWLGWVHEAGNPTLKEAQQ